MIPFAVDNPTQIFELQSLLLSEDAGAIDEALLRECAAWFRPQHLQDIVIERSEAEGRCVVDGRPAPRGC